MARLGLVLAAPQAVGGQAVMEGVMIRVQDRLAIAVRRPSGDIVVEERPWFSMARLDALKKPFLRGFPVLVETMVNGVKALNYSAQQALEEEGEELTPLALAGTLAAAIGLALGLFVVVPHLVSLALGAFGLAGGVDSLSFHAWDGFFKLAIFMAYVGGISFVPDIRRVFQYHGAEHKVVWAYEKGDELIPALTMHHSRLHPRCGTTFILFVLAASIVLYTVLVPALAAVWSPQNAVLEQAYFIGVKLALMIPISNIAYELIRFAGRFDKSVFSRLISMPGMAMQMLTTYEPDEKQVEVAISALNGAFADEAA
jgi:uncharacterized protein YqhQ